MTAVYIDLREGDRQFTVVLLKSGELCSVFSHCRRGEEPYCRSLKPDSIRAKRLISKAREESQIVEPQ